MRTYRDERALDTDPAKLMIICIDRITTGNQG